jgi:hypothetical protein
MSYDDDDSRCGAEFRRWRRQRELELDNQVYGVPAEERPVVEPCRPTEPLTTPALPGNYYAGQAYKHGCEDEYANKMKARFGGEW